MNPHIPLAIVAAGAFIAFVWARCLGYEFTMTRRDKRGRFCK